jgi:hypothetical protein
MCQVVEVFVVKRRSTEYGVPAIGKFPSRGFEIAKYEPVEPTVPQLKVVPPTLTRAGVIPEGATSGGIGV